MNRTHLAVLFALSWTVAASTPLLADVKTEDKTLVAFEGALGKVANLFGGKAAKEGVKRTVAVKGDRKASFGDTDGTIVDLREEKIYDLDMKKKSYTVMTFAELRRRMEDARKKAEQRAGDDEKASKKEGEKAPELEMDFTVKPTGERRTINGFDTKQVIMTLTVREKGKTLEQGGGLVMTSDIWLTPTIAEMKELVEFEIRYAKQIGLAETLGATREQMQAALAAHPKLKDAQVRMAEEARKMDGTAILTTTTIDSVKSAEQMAAAQKREADEEPSPADGVGKLLGGFGKKLAKKKAGGNEPPAARATFMTTTVERLSVSTAVAAADVAVPAGFKEEK